MDSRVSARPGRAETSAQVSSLRISAGWDKASASSSLPRDDWRVKVCQPLPRSCFGEPQGYGVTLPTSAPGPRPPTRTQGPGRPDARRFPTIDTQGGSRSPHFLLQIFQCSCSFLLFDYVNTTV